MAELVYLKAEFGPDHINFVDDIFGLKPGWLRRYATLVEEAELKIPFRCLTRVDLLGEDADIDALRRAGCETVWIGAESGSQKILDAMEKGSTVSQIYNVCRKLQAAGIQVAFFLQFGYPGETREDIQKTRSMLADCLPDDIGISVSYPLPGTKFYERVRAELGVKKNWENSEDLAIMYRSPFNTEFYRQLHRVIHKEFRIRRTMRDLRRKLSRPWTLEPEDAKSLVRSAYDRLSLRRAERRLDELGRFSRPELRVSQHMSRKEASEPTPQAGSEP